MVARWMIVGAVLWALVMAAFRFATSAVFAASPIGVSWLFMLLPALMFGLTFFLLIALKTERADRAEVAAIFALPGFLIGIYEINSFTAVFPQLSAADGAPFAAIMFASYAAVIIAGIVSSRLQQRDASVHS